MKSKQEHQEPYGWLHFCGELYYQLDHPEDCKCSKEGEWVWYEKEGFDEELCDSAIP